MHRVKVRLITELMVNNVTIELPHAWMWPHSPHQLAIESLQRIICSMGLAEHTEASGADPSHPVVFHVSEGKIYIKKL